MAGVLSEVRDSDPARERLLLIDTREGPDDLASRLCRQCENNGLVELGPTEGAMTATFTSRFGHGSRQQV